MVSCDYIFILRYITFYNMIFTALPLVIRATFDQDINYRIHIEYSDNELLLHHYYYFRKIRLMQQSFEKYLREKFPTIYYIGQKKTIFTIPNYVFWAFQGVIHALIIYFFGYWCFDKESLVKKGYPGGMSSFSLTLFTSVILVIYQPYNFCIDC